MPFYQRAYVWRKEEQWEPLWNDIRDKAEARLNGQLPAPHFLGAIVLEPQERRGLRGVETYHIIDGQQRLTTLQYFLAAMVMAIRDDDRSAILTLIKGCLWNPNPDTMEQPETERFKVWPTFRDREDYRLAMEADGRDDLRERFPSSFTQTDTLKRIGIDHPPVLEAIWFFNDQIETWLASTQNGNNDRGEWLETLAEAALRDLKLVAISLDKDDDAQVIFETLNGRGAELHATDLIRNFIFSGRTAKGWMARRSMTACGHLSRDLSGPTGKGAAALSGRVSNGSYRRRFKPSLRIMSRSDVSTPTIAVTASVNRRR